jgi:iron complex outermembrane receptor protein
MSRKKTALFAAAASAAALSLHGQAVFAQEAGASSTSVGEVVVTANKRQENIQTVPMSITAASGDKLTRLGVTDTSQLQKLVPGFSYVPSAYGTPIYSIRGVGFQDTSLGDSPTVSVYVDEAPLPFSAMTQGASLDLQRVEVLKGPQGTLFGENATGGAINYIANKPTDHFQAGADLSYGRFNTLDLQGFVGGPITDTLDFRIAARTVQAGNWQKSYGPQAPAGLGKKNFNDGRISLLFKPTDKFKALLTVSGWQDRSDTQAAQLVKVEPLNGNTNVATGFLNFPAAPHDARAADWQSCINTSGYTYGPNANLTCARPRNDNTFYNATLRMDYELPGDMTLTSLTSYNRFDRNSAIAGDGTTYQDYESIQGGFLRSTYQELRLAGKFAGRGAWIVGANYEYDDTWDNFLQSYGDSSSSKVTLDADGPIPLGPTHPVDRQKTSTYAVYGNAEFPITDTLTLQGGVRYTKQDKSFDGCELNGDLGQYSGIISVKLQELYQALNGGVVDGILPAYNQCASLGPASNDFHPALIHEELNQSNVAWRTGVQWKVLPQSMLYFNVSQGYKGGGFPTLSQSTATQSNPVVQESLLAYEGGFKSTLLDHTLQLNGAAFYYDYKDKQILGDIDDPTFGALPSLVNVPRSHVIGFELSGAWTPRFLEGLTVTPSVSYQHSRIDSCPASNVNCAADPIDGIPAGHFHNYNYKAHIQDFNGEAFPLAPEWQADVDVQYEWNLHNDVKAFVGANINYQGATNSGFGDFAILDVPAYTLVDLRAGVEKDAWRFQVWGRNVTNQYYWTAAYHVNDADIRYAGMPATYGFTLSYRYH